MQAAGNNVVHRFRDKITVAPGGDEVMSLKTLESDVSCTENTKQYVLYHAQLAIYALHSKPSSARPVFL
jgi:hypothetical protein